MEKINQLKNHLKNFTVKELKKEVLNIKKGFQVSKLKRAEVEKVILKNHQHFIHLLKKNKVKKTNPSTKKTKSIKKNILNKQQLEMLLNNEINDAQVKTHINQILDKLDAKAVDARHPEFIYERQSGVTIQKGKSRYIIRNDSGDVLLSTEDRKQVEDMIYYMLK